MNSTSINQSSEVEMRNKTGSNNYIKVKNDEKEEVIHKKEL